MLTADHRQLIARHPIAGGLRSFCLDFAALCSELALADAPDAFRHLVQLAPSNTAVKSILARLLVCIQGLAAVNHLQRPGASDSLLFEILQFGPHVVSGALDVEVTALLLDKVVSEAPDESIWEAIFNLVASQASPALSKPSSQTPLKINSASHMQFSKTRSAVDVYLREELHDLLFRDTPAFFDTFFSNPLWRAKATRLLRDLRLVDQRNPLKWQKPPSESTVTAWFHSFVNGIVLPAAQCHYQSSPTRSIKGGEGKRQCDLFLCRNPPATGVSRWPDILVPAELKQNSRLSNRRDIVVQLASYVREVFGSQATRRSVHAFTICGSKLRCWLFHRAGAIGSELIDINNDPEIFLTVMIGYASMDLEEMGFDPTIKLHGDAGVYDTIAITLKDGTIQEMQIQQPFFKQCVIASRGTVCRLARMPTDKEWKYVVKDSWRSAERQPEGNFLKEAQEKGVWGVARYYAHEDVTVGGAIDDVVHNVARGLKMGTPMKLIGRKAGNDGAYSISVDGSSSSQDTSSTHTGTSGNFNTPTTTTDSNHLLSSCSSKSKRKANTPSIATCNKRLKVALHQNRIHSRTVVSSVGRPIHRFSSITELLSAFIDAIKAHQSLYTKANILHRDISINNLMITEPPPCAKSLEPRGFLIDLDMAAIVPPPSSTDGDLTSSGAPHRTGTMEFMAIGVLLGHQHTYRHDLESFLYVFLWICITDRSTHDTHMPSHEILQSWTTTDFPKAARDKQGSMTLSGFDAITAAFRPKFNVVKPLAMKLRSVLFGDRVDIGTEEWNGGALYKHLLDAFEEGLRNVENSEQRRGT